MFKISVPKPCHENWDAMGPREQGRHCNSCEKTVVDFTQMDDESVKNFFISRMHEHVCGRFTGSQLSRIKIDLPANIFEIKMPRWKRFLVACLITFSTTLFSCDVSTNGLSFNGETSGLISVTDTTPPDQRMTVGMIMIPEKPKTDTIKKCTEVKGEIEYKLMGDVQLVDSIPPPQQPLMGVPVMEEVQEEKNAVIVGKPELNTNIPVKEIKPKTDCDNTSYQ